MGTKRFNVKSEEYQKKVQLFQETLKRIDKQAIIWAFQLGLEVDYFVYEDTKTGQIKRMHPNNDLFYQFNDNVFVYIIMRMPINKIKKDPKSKIAYAILNKNEEK